MQHTRRLHYLRASYYCAVHKLLMCSAWKIARVQYTKVDSRAAHLMSHTCFDSNHNKIWRTHVCSLQAIVNLDMSCTEFYCCSLCLRLLVYIFYITNAVVQQVDIRISKNQVLQILYSLVLFSSLVLLQFFK